MFGYGSKAQSTFSRHAVALLAWKSGPTSAKTLAHFCLSLGEMEKVAPLSTVYARVSQSLYLR